MTAKPIRATFAGYRPVPSRSVGAAHTRDTTPAHLWAAAAERLAERVSPEPNSGCILWDGLSTRHGYGVIRVGRLNWPAHRFAWTIENGPIPLGAILLHRCDTPACVNANHLRVGTQSDNVRDMTEKGRRARGTAFVTRTHLTERDIREIRVDRRSQRVVAAEYGITQSQVSRIRLRKNWGHVE